ncbi:MAG TPA: DNA translocase FtsK 4TM domain-containing protein, partial [Kofleriaceae bacterium]|nr:DNA translocase FtsK 4TM domain-containing protein [Kofleriaceae bacterium]
MVGLGASIFLLIAMISLQAGRLIMGPFGRSTAGLFYGIAGVCGYFLIALAVVAAIRMLTEREPILPATILAGTMVGVVSLAILVHLAASGYRVAGHGPGGALGEHLGEILRAVVSTAGTALLALIGLLVAAVVATPLRMRDVLHAIGGVLHRAGAAIGRAMMAVARFWGAVFGAMLPERSADDEDEDDEIVEVDERDVLEVGDDEAGDEPVIVARPKKSKKRLEATELELDAAAVKAEAELDKTDKTDTKPADKDGKKGKTLPAIEVVEEGEAAAAAASAPARGKRTRFASGTQTPEMTDDAPAEPAAAAEPAPAPAAADPGPVIVESRFKNADKAAMAAKEKAAEAERQTFVKLGEGDYKLPSIQLLNFDATATNQIDKTAMLELSAKLTQTLENYGVKGDVVAIRPGPVVTMYEFAPAPGVRVNKIVNLSDDLALALEALRVRIVAPIPGKAAVGIEVPNKTREKVFLKEIVADELFMKGRGKLPMA